MAVNMSEVIVNRYSRNWLAVLIFLVIARVTHASHHCSDSSEVCVDPLGEQFDALAGAMPDAIGMLQTHLSMERLSEISGQQPKTKYDPAVIPGPHGSPLWEIPQTLPILVPGVLMTVSESTERVFANNFTVSQAKWLPVYLLLVIGVGCLLLMVGCKFDSAVTKSMESRQEAAPETQKGAGDADADGACSVDRRGPGPASTAPPPQTPDGVSFFKLFRFATTWECILMALAMSCSFTQGSLLVNSTIHMGEVLIALQIPNDDGSVPPAAGPHTLRDAELRNWTKFFFWLAISGTVLRILAWQLAVTVAERMQLRMRLALFKKLMRVDVAWYDRNQPEEVAALLSQQPYVVRQGTGEQVVELFRNGAICIVGMVLIFLKCWRASLLMAMNIPIMLTIFGIMTQTMHKAGYLAGMRKTEATALFSSTLSCSRTVVAFNGQERAIESHSALTERGCWGLRLVSYQTVVMMISRSTFTYSALALGIFWQSIAVSSDFEAGCWASAPPFGSCINGSAILAVFFTLNKILGTGVAGIPLALEKIGAASVAAKRVYDQLDEKVSIHQHGKKLPKPKGQIQYKSVSFSYPSRPHAAVLVDFTLSIEAGTSCGFVGPSGSGKSTLLALLLRFYQPQVGQVLLDGENVQGLGLRWLRSKMSLVEQDPILFAGSITENIQRGSVVKVDSSQIERAARLANAHDFIVSLAKGYETELGEKGVGLSGGQKQRVAIARALIRDPAVLLLDEATSALDATSERIVQAAIDQLMDESVHGSGNRTTLIVAHRLSSVRRVDKICVLAHGRFVELGSHEELASNPSSAYSRLIALQSSEGASHPAEDETPRMDVANSATEPKHIDAAIKNLCNDDEVPNKRTPDKIVNECKPQPSPSTKLWKYAIADIHIYVLASVLALTSAVMGPMLFAQITTTVHAMDRPPAAYDEISRTWVPIYDSGILITSVVQRCFIIPIFAIMGEAGGMVVQALFGYAAINLTQRITRVAITAVMKQDLEWQEKQSVGFLTECVAADVDRMKTLTSDSLAMILYVSMTLVIVSLIQCLLCWQFYLTTMVSLVLPMIGTAGLYGYMARANIDMTAGFVREALSGIRTVVAFGCENALEERFSKVMTKDAQQMIKSSVPQSLCVATMTFGWTFFLGGICLFGGLFINRGVLDPRVASIVVFVSVGLFAQIGDFTRFTGDYALAKEAAERLFDIIDRKPVINNMSTTGVKPKALPGDVHFKNVNFSYTGCSSQILTNFDLKVERGSAVALVGPSGCGKSSTLSLVLRFFDPTSGLVMVDGHNIRTLSLQWLREHISLVQQEPVLFTGTIEDNIKYGKMGASSEQVQAVAILAQADSFISKLADGYQTEAGSRGSKLSGGQKQRIAIARALVREPSVLLLDEATSALDAVSEKLVMDELYRVRDEAKMTIMIVAHRLSTIREANKICVMSEGSIVETGQHADLLENVGGPYHCLIHQQNIKAPKPAESTSSLVG